jgi:hypothetical protein
MLTQRVNVRFVAPMVGHLARVAGRWTVSEHVLGCFHGKGYASGKYADGTGPSGKRDGRGWGVLPDPARAVPDSAPMDAVAPPAAIA